MKKVFRNSSETLHIWAQQTQEEGRCPNVFFNKAVVYSYGHHFPLGVMLNLNGTFTRMVAINSNKYSVTTTKHQTEIKDAVHHYRAVYTPTEIMKVLASVQGDIKRLSSYDKKRIKEIATRDIECAIKSAIASMTKRRKSELIVSDVEGARRVYNTFDRLFITLGMKTPIALTRKIKNLEENTAEIREKAAIEYAQAQEKKRKYEAELQAKYEKAMPEAIEAWCNHKGPYDIPDEKHRSFLSEVLRSREDAILRVSKDEKEIETTKGARFPIKDAIEAMQYIVYTKQSMQSVDFKPGKEPKLGNYRINSIAQCGDVKAGCHFVKWESIARCAKQLGVL